MQKTGAHRLSKSRFVAGWSCPKLLWLKVHEPGAKELQPNVVLEDLFDQGRLVEERAREEFPGGMVIAADYRDPARFQRTQEAIAGGVGVLFRPSFEHGAAFCEVDALERTPDGWTLVEVKSANSVKDKHIPDVAFQVYVARACGLNVTRAEVMHLNREYRHPGGIPLFVRSDVTADVERLVPEIPSRVDELLAMLGGPCPAAPLGLQCWDYDGCAFFKSCWPKDDDHIRHLWNVGPAKTMAWLAKGVSTMTGIPSGERLNEKQERQIRAQRTGKLIVERGLAEALRPVAEARTLGFLDFETVQRAVPVWGGMAPNGQAAAQFSYHEKDASGTMRHEQFLAEGPPDPSLMPDDPREPLARAMLLATAKADRIVVYTSFEKTQINALAGHLPHLAAELNALVAKLWDLNPVVANNVYHPAFRGSFSLKDILKPLVEDLDYTDLVIVDGKVASVKIARLLFVSGRIPPAERDKTRKDLLEYCERDTFATVRLVGKLAELATK